MTTTARNTTCIWCHQTLRDGRVESGYTGKGPDWCTVDGDYGCNDSPGTNNEGCYGHIGRASLKSILMARFDNVEVKALLERLEVQR